MSESCMGETEKWMEGEGEEEGEKEEEEEKDEIEGGVAALAKKGGRAARTISSAAPLPLPWLSP